MNNKETKKIDVATLLNPNSYKVKKTYCDEDGGLLSYDVQIVDDELDPYDVHINYDKMEISTENYTHISLGIWHLNYLNDLLLQFEEQINLESKIL